MSTREALRRVLLAIDAAGLNIPGDDLATLRAALARADARRQGPGRPRKRRYALRDVQRVVDVLDHMNSTGGSQKDAVAHVGHAGGDRTLEEDVRRYRPFVVWMREHGYLAEPLNAKRLFDARWDYEEWLDDLALEDAPPGPRTDPRIDFGYDR